MRIEPVTRMNVAYVVQLAKDMHALSSFSNDGPEFVWETTLDNFSRLMGFPTYYFRAAIQDDGVYCGAVLGHIEQFLFNRAVLGVEDAWFVLPKTPARARVGKQLMQGFIDWCMGTHNAHHIQSGDVASIDTVAVKGLYNHLGFTQYGTIYRYVRREP